MDVVTLWYANDWDLERGQVGDGNVKGVTGERHNANGVYTVEIIMVK